MFIKSMALIAVWRLIWINLRAAGASLNDVRCHLAVIRFVGGTARLNGWRRQESTGPESSRFCRQMIF